LDDLASSKQERITAVKKFKTLKMSHLNRKLIIFANCNLKKKLYCWLSQTRLKQTSRGQQYVCIKVIIWDLKNLSILYVKLRMCHGHARNSQVCLYYNLIVRLDFGWSK